MCTPGGLSRGPLMPRGPRVQGGCVRGEGWAHGRVGAVAPAVAEGFFGSMSEPLRMPALFVGHSFGAGQE